MKRFTTHLLLSAGLAMFCVSSVFAQRPGGGGGSSSLGKIQYVAGNFTCTMNSDGTGKQNVSPVLVQNALRAPLSAKKYGSGRWQLMLENTSEIFERYEDLNGNRQYDVDTETLSTFPGVEVFAYRWSGSAWQVLQVTDTSRDGFRELHYSDADISLAWSNDGNDSFLSVRLTGSELDDDGRYLKSTSFPQYIARIHVSGTDLDRGIHPLVGAYDPEFELAAVDLSATIDDYAQTFSSHSWSPDGTKLVIGDSGTNGNPGAILSVWDVATGTSQFLAWTRNDLGVTHHWSPDGQKILIGDGGSDVQVVNPDGSGLTTLLASTQGGTFYSFPYWSPDSKWIVYRKLAATRSICKVPAAGGKEVNLTKDLNGITQFPLGWTRD